MTRNNSPHLENNPALTISISSSASLSLKQAWIINNFPQRVQCPNQFFLCCSSVMNGFEGFVWWLMEALWRQMAAFTVSGCWGLQWWCKYWRKRLVVWQQWVGGELADLGDSRTLCWWLEGEVGWSLVGGGWWVWW